MPDLQYRRYAQFVCVIAANLLYGCVTIYGAWVSPALPYLTSQNSSLGVALTEDQESWFVAIDQLVVPIGAIAAATLANLIGRKLSLLIAAIPILISFLLPALLIHPTALILSRAIGGITEGLAFVLLPMYIGEVAEKDIRGKLGVTKDYFSFTLSCCAFPVAFVLFFIFMPESPYHLIKTGKKNEAVQSLYRLSHSNASSSFIESRLLEIELSVKKDTENSSGFWDLFKCKKNIKAVLFSLGVGFCFYFSGYVIIQKYLQTIIGATNSTISPEVSSIIFGVVQLPSVLLAAYAVDKIGRKLLLVISLTGSAIALISEGIYFYIQDELNADVNNISWLPTVALTFYLLFVCFGAVVLPSVVSGELFSIDIKSYAVAFCISINSLCGFGIARLFTVVSTLWGTHVIMWIFAGTCLLLSLFGLFILPETKGKSFLEVQDMLENRKIIHTIKCC